MLNFNFFHQIFALFFFSRDFRERKKCENEVNWWRKLKRFFFSLETLGLKDVNKKGVIIGPRERLASKVGVRKPHYREDKEHATSK